MEGHAGSSSGHGRREQGKAAGSPPGRKSGSFSLGENEWDTVLQSQDGLKSRGGGMLDHRVVPTSVYLLQPTLGEEVQEKLTIGELYVHMVGARDLPSGDLNGKSDPYCKLALTGRFLSHGQEWPERMAFHSKTHVKKATLNPEWDEEFIFPVRRAGAILRVEVYDWDLTSQDDLLGVAEIPLTGDLLTQRVVDSWYPVTSVDADVDGAGVSEDDASVSIPPTFFSEDLMSDSAASMPPPSELAPGEAMSVSFDLDDDANSLGREEGRLLHETSANMASVLEIDGAMVDSRPRRPKKFLPAGLTRKKGAGIKNKKTNGELHIRLWFQFSPVGEFVSHCWFEDPYRPVLERFSPNRFYRKLMRFYHLFKPWFEVMQYMDDVQSWERPDDSLKWAVILVIVLLYPPLLFILCNGYAARVIWTNYCSRLLREMKAKEEAIAETQSSSLNALPAAPSAAVGASSTLSGSNSKKGRRISITNFATVPGHRRSSSAGELHGISSDKIKTAARRMTTMFAFDEKLDDPELLAMEERLKRERQFNTFINEVGKKLLGKSGPEYQYKLDKFSWELADVRSKFHPKTRSRFVLLMTALSCNFFIQTWMFYSGTFHFYLAFLVFGRFAQKFYKKRGKAIINGFKLALKSQEMQQQRKSRSWQVLSSAAHKISVQKTVLKSLTAQKESHAQETSQAWRDRESFRPTAKDDEREEGKHPVHLPLPSFPPPRSISASVKPKLQRRLRWGRLAVLIFTVTSVAGLSYFIGAFLNGLHAVM